MRHKFRKWLEKETLRGAAKKLGVDPSAVWAWRHGKSCPRPELMREIKILSNGKVNYTDIINHYLQHGKGLR